MRLIPNLQFNVCLHRSGREQPGQASTAATAGCGCPTLEALQSGPYSVQGCAISVGHGSDSAGRLCCAAAPALAPAVSCGSCSLLIFWGCERRSQDYNALLYAFNQLFDRVDATKPVASRNTSAEIFVTCKGYKAPARIDPRLLDVKHLFKVSHSQDLLHSTRCSLPHVQDNPLMAYSSCLSNFLCASCLTGQLHGWLPTRRRRQSRRQLRGRMRC